MPSIRLLVLLALVLALGAVAASLSPSSQPPSPSNFAPGLDKGMLGERPPIQKFRISANPQQPARKLPVQIGQTVDLTVSSVAPDSVEIERLGLLEAVDPDSPALLEFFADSVGNYPVTLTSSHSLIAIIQVVAPTRHR